MNEEERKLLYEIKRELEQLKRSRVYQQNIVPLAVKQRHIDGIIIFRGNVADRPSNGDTEIQAYYAEDEKKLYIWNSVNDAWEYEELT